jgi:proline dehydrogenase
MNLNAGLEKLFAGRWIAGYYPKDAIDRTKFLNSKGISTLINYLGEDFSNITKVRDAVSTYMELIDQIQYNKICAYISLKPTQIGLCISYNLMLSNYIKIVKHAKSKGIFIWFDMEAPETVNDTIKAYKSAIKYGNTGICIQSYLKRSGRDISELIKKKGKIRLVKGAYHLKTNEVFKSHRQVSHNYRILMEKLIKSSNNFMLATHDSQMIDQAIKLNKKYKKNITFAMLSGIRNKYARYLVEHRHKVSLYVPFGSDWIGFSYRRLIEQRHMKIIVRSLFQSQKI